MDSTVLFLHGALVRTSRLILEGLAAFAAERICGVTKSCGRSKTCAAVCVWISAPERKALIIASSPAICANTRSSIWE